MDLYPEEFLETIRTPLTAYYAIACAANLGAVLLLRRRRFFWMVAWLAVAAGFGVLAGGTAAGRPPGPFGNVKRAIDGLIRRPVPADQGEVDAVRSRTPPAGAGALASRSGGGPETRTIGPTRRHRSW